LKDFSLSSQFIVLKRKKKDWSPFWLDIYKDPN
jgi:hypothetical protein